MEVKFSTLKGSEKHKIIAAVLEILESKNFSLDRTFEIQETVNDPARWVMGFQSKKASWNDLAETKRSLGEKFDVEITGKSKELFTFRVEAPAEEFIRLAQQSKPLTRFLTAPSAGASPSSGQQPTRSPYGSGQQGPSGTNTRTYNQP